MARAKSNPFQLEAVLAVFRSLERSDDAIVVLGDDAAMRVLVAWSHLDQSWQRPATAQPQAIHGRLGRLWDWVVAGWELDARAVSRVAGVPMATAHKKLSVLVGNRLIYPDGSMSTAVQRALTLYTAKKIGIKQVPAKSDAKAAPKPVDDDRGN